LRSRAPLFLRCRRCRLRFCTRCFSFKRWFIYSRMVRVARLPRMVCGFLVSALPTRFGLPRMVCIRAVATHRFLLLPAAVSALRFSWHHTPGIITRRSTRFLRVFLRFNGRAGSFNNARGILAPQVQHPSGCLFIRMYTLPLHHRFKRLSLYLLNALPQRRWPRVAALRAPLNARSRVCRARALRAALRAFAGAYRAGSLSSASSLPLASICVHGFVLLRLSAAMSLPLRPPPTPYRACTPCHISAAPPRTCCTLSLFYGFFHSSARSLRPYATRSAQVRAVLSSYLLNMVRFIFQVLLWYVWRGLYASAWRMDIITALLLLYAGFQHRACTA